jgi:hypothetical protein
MTKHCSRCHRTQPLTAFAHHAGRTGGWQTWCKACVSLVPAPALRPAARV